jgi:hypothetical protein
VFADRAEQAARGLRTADAARQLDAIAADLEDTRAALQWSLQQAGDRTVGQRLAASLSWFWFIRGPWGEASDWLTAATSFPVDDPALRRRLLHAASLTAMARADLTRAHELAEQHRAEAALAADPADEAEATEYALRRYRESVERCLRVGTTGGIPSALEGLSSIAFAEGSPNRSLQLLAAAGALRARLGVPAPASLVTEHDELVASPRRSLGDSFDASWAAGEQIPLDPADDGSFVRSLICSTTGPSAAASRGDGSRVG